MGDILECLIVRVSTDSAFMRTANVGDAGTEVVSVHSCGYLLAVLTHEATGVHTANGREFTQLGCKQQDYL